jgi:hypothetical protein
MIRCEKCHVTGPYVPMKNAVRHWNTRKVKTLDAERLEAERDEARASYQAMVGHDLRKRLRAVAQTLIAEVGADGPCDAEDAAANAVDIIRRLRVEVTR